MVINITFITIRSIVEDRAIIWILVNLNGVKGYEIEY